MSAFFVYLRNGSDPNASVNGSVTPVVFSYTATTWCSIGTMIISVRDSGSFAAGNYGAIAGGLPNGLDIELVNSGVVTDLLDGVPIQTNLDWITKGFEGKEASLSGGGNKGIIVRWLFSNSGAPLRMIKDDTLRVRINDDCTGLTKHRFEIRGVTGYPGREWGP